MKRGRQRRERTFVGIRVLSIGAANLKRRGKETHEKKRTHAKEGRKRQDDAQGVIERLARFPGGSKSYSHRYQEREDKSRERERERREIKTDPSKQTGQPPLFCW
jgi:hypothetical protein